MHKLAAVVLGQSNIIRPFRGKTDYLEYGKIVAIRTLRLFCRIANFYLMKGRIMLFRSETIVASFVCVMVLICKVFIDHYSKHQYVVLFAAMSMLV